MIIDAHVHFIVPPLNDEYIKWLKETGRKDYGPLYLWNKPDFQDIEMHIDEMNKYGIEKSVVTYSANVVQMIDVIGKTKYKKREIINNMNQQMLAIQNRYHDRMIVCAWVDPNDTDILETQMKEVKKNGFRAISILSAYHDGDILFLDHPRYDKFWKLANELELPVFIHFSNLYHIDDKNQPLSGYMSDTLLYAGMGQLMEDSLCIARLVLSGLFEKYPHLKVVLGQLGGMLPFMMERFDMLYSMYLNGAKQQGKNVTDKTDLDNYMRKLSDYKKNIYVDTHSMSQASIEAAAKILGDSHILYGSDYPITPAYFGRKHALKQIESIDSELKKKILYENAAELLKI